MTWAQLPGYLSAAWLVERAGRKPVLAGYLAAAALATVTWAVAGHAAETRGSPLDDAGAAPAGARGARAASSGRIG